MTTSHSQPHPSPLSAHPPISTHLPPPPLSSAYTTSSSTHPHPHHPHPHPHFTHAHHAHPPSHVTQALPPPRYPTHAHLASAPAPQLTHHLPPVVNPPSYALAPPPPPGHHGIPSLQHTLLPPPSSHPVHPAHPAHPVAHTHAHPHHHPSVDHDDRHLTHQHSAPMHGTAHQPPPHLPSIGGPLPSGYYESPTTKIARLESQLAAAQAEIDRLRARLSDVEKDRGKGETPKVQSRYWTPTEHKRFLEALQKFGPKDVRAIANFVGSRNATQVRTHAQKYFLRIARERRAGGALAAARKRSMSESDLARVGRAVGTPPGSPREQDDRADVRDMERESGTEESGRDRFSEREMEENERPSSPRSSQDVTMTNGDKGEREREHERDIDEKREVEVGASGNKPPVGAKMSDNSGINLLSLVASSRKVESSGGAGVAGGGGGGGGGDDGGDGENGVGVSASSKAEKTVDGR